MRQQSGSRYGRSRPHSQIEENINTPLHRTQSFEQSNDIVKKCTNNREKFDEPVDIETSKDIAFIERRSRSERYSD